MLLLIPNLISIKAQKTDYFNQPATVKELLVKLEKEKLAKDSEMLRMKLEMEKIKVKNQWLIIIFSVAICLIMVTLTLNLYFSRKQIRKKNWLLNEQNQSINAQNEEITLQSEQLALKNEFLFKQNQQLVEVNHEKDKLLTIIVEDLQKAINESKSLAERLNKTTLQPEQFSMATMIIQANNNGLVLIDNIFKRATLTIVKH
jgi:hypothetical protein